jgi:hypothetical protein
MGLGKGKNGLPRPAFHGLAPRGNWQSCLRHSEPDQSQAADRLQPHIGESRSVRALARFPGNRGRHVEWVLWTHAAFGDSWRPIARACGARTLQLRPVPGSQFPVPGHVGWVLWTHAAFGDSWRPIARACGARTLQLRPVPGSQFPVPSSRRCSPLHAVVRAVLIPPPVPSPESQVPPFISRISEIGLT